MQIGWSSRKNGMKVETLNDAEDLMLERFPMDILALAW